MESKKSQDEAPPTYNVATAGKHLCSNLYLHSTNK